MTLSKSDSQIIESPFGGKIFAQCFKSTSIQQYQYIWYSGFNTHILKKDFFAVTSKLSGSENSLKPVVLLCSILAQSRFSFTISIKSQDFEFALPLHYIQCPFTNQIQFGLEKLHPKIAYNFPNQFQFGLERKKLILQDADSKPNSDWFGKF